MVERGMPPFLNNEYCDKSLSDNNYCTLRAMACVNFICLSLIKYVYLKSINIIHKYLVRHSERFVF